MKKFFRVALIVALLVCSAIAATACGSEKISGIELIASPQLTYVKGTEGLNLEGGKLRVHMDGDFSEISLTESGVSVSGFNGSELGEQTITVSYKKQETTFTVNVVERITTESIETNYFVGEAFNMTAGSLKITRDDGTQFNVEFNSTALTLKDPANNTIDGDFKFTNAQTGTKISVTYNYGETYTGEFSVNVYAIADFSIGRPSKTSYKNHESLNLTGGYIMLRNQDGSFTRRLTLTEDMVSGYDPSAVTIENYLNGTTVSQTLTVSYAGKMNTYDITLSFSDVSLVQYRVNELKEISDLNLLTKEQGKNALEAAVILTDLSNADKAYIDADDQELVVRAAVAYGYDLWSTAMESAKDVWYLSGDVIYFSSDLQEVGGNELAEGVLAALTDEVLAIGTNLVTIARYYPDVEIDEEVTLVEYLKDVRGATTYTSSLNMLSYLLDVYDVLGKVTSATDSSNIIAAYNYLVDSGAYFGVNYKDMYAVVTAWIGAPVFDYMYTYYYNNGANDTVYNNLAKFYLPEKLQNLFDDVYSAMMQILMLRNAASAQVAWETTMFMYYYNSALTQSAAISAGSDMNAVLYGKILFGDIIYNTGTGASVLVSFDDLIDYLTTTTYGYRTVAGAQLENTAFADLWADYLDLYEKIVIEENEVSDYDSQIEAMFNKLLAMAPSDQYAFMVSVYPEIPAYTLRASYFVNIIALRYFDILESDAEREFISRLFDAITQIAFGNNEAYFKNNMKVLTDIYNGNSEQYPLTDNSAISGNKTLKDAYDKYVAIYNMYLGLEEEDAQKFSELATDASKKLLTEFENTANEFLYYYFFVSSYGDTGCLIQMFAAYEKLEVLAAKILASNDNNAINAYYYELVNFHQMVNSSQYTFFTQNMDIMRYYAREQSIAYMISVFFDDNDYIYDVYRNTNLKEFLSESAYVMFMNFVENKEVLTGEEQCNQIFGIMQAFRELNAYDRWVLLVMDAGYDWYYNGLLTFFKELLKIENGDGTISNAAYDAAELLFIFERVYAYYECDADEAVTASDLQDAWKNFEEIYNDLTDEEKEVFDEYLGTLHSYYQTIVNGIAAASEDAA